MIGVRLNTFSDNSGEPEQDANSALTELDKGLRSGKVGEQCEAIVRFPRLFEKYPFPILINSSFLKLADVFRMGNNFLRLWVLRVCQQSEKHLDKILNVDEFLRRVFSVLHSNDPVARALALRTLGAVAGIIPERQNVHHAIRRGLDSHDNVEVEAAIYATTRFAAHSNAFAVAMCNKLSDMVECESTGAERRAKLVRALRTVHGGAVRAGGVLKLLRSLLERFPSSSSVRAAISALTAIAHDTVVHVPDQVELLLSIATNDARSSVRRAALLGLKTLAQHAALWPAASVQALVRTAADADPKHTMLCLEVMQILVECPAVIADAAGSAQRALRELCARAALDSALRPAATAAHVLTRRAVHCYEEGIPVEGAELMLALENIVIATGVPDGQDNIRPLRMALRCLVQLCNAAPVEYAPRTGRLLTSQLRATGWRQGGPRALALLEALGALGGGTHGALTLTLTDLMDGADISEPVEDGTALVLLCTVIFQERAAKALKCKINGAWQEKIKEAISSADGWTKYRVARAALRYGHHRLAAHVLEGLLGAASSEATQRWLASLHRAAKADAELVEQGITGLEAAASSWEVAGGWGGAGAAGGGCAGCAGCAACTPLAGAWIAARAQALATLARTADRARVLCTQPPPAVAQASRSPCAAAGACAAALRKAARSARAVAERYAHIARTAFHADEATLTHLQISQHTFTQLSEFLERLTGQAAPRALFVPALRPASLDEKIALAPAEAILNISNKLFDDPTTGNGITHRHAAGVLAAVRAAGAGAVWPRAVCEARACGALCRLSLTPGGRGAEQAAALPHTHHLALKAEGVILPPPRGKSRPPRQVKLVQLTVTATPHPRSNEKTVELTNVPPVLSAVQAVAPLRDFFSAQQLVAVAAPGLYTVAVEAAFVDQHGALWNTGPRTSIVIKAHEDSSAKGNTQTARGRF
ncbi:integrator complex subunit 7 [Cydia pomonella]|uniref:integrator complex subunit 7 n=1 Tax=Cydia pomonella TaxID=82600 RepID=UPI002ADE508E|nr:integrator complex subunit 7 [Cydia pomonella]